MRTLLLATNKLAWKWLLRKSNIPCVIAHSRYVQNIVENYGYQTGKSRLIPLGFKRGEYAAQAAALSTLSNSPKILTVSGIAHTKGQHDAILAMTNLKHDFPNFTYQLIGEVSDDSYLKFLNKLIDQKSLSKQIKITPKLYETSKQSALQQAVFNLQPSHEEGFCLSYIEAAGIVSRLIGTITGAIVLINSDNLGMQVVSPKSPTDIADSIRKLAKLCYQKIYLSLEIFALKNNFDKSPILINKNNYIKSLALNHLCRLWLNTSCAKIFVCVAMNNGNIKISIKKTPRQMAFLLSKRQSNKHCFKALIETMDKAGVRIGGKMPLTE